MSKNILDTFKQAAVILTLACVVTDGLIIFNAETINKQRIECAQDTTIEINRESIPSSVKFVLFEAHSQWYNLTVSFLPQLNYGQHENGTSIGIIVRNTSSPVVFVSCQNRKDAKYIDVLIKATVYGKEDPVPGGCNLEFPLEEDPNIHTIPGSFTTRVAFQYANIGSTVLVPQPNCEKKPNQQLLHYVLYEYIIGDISDQSYFHQLTNILKGTANGQKISQYTYGSGHTTETFGSRLRQGSVFVVEVTQSDREGVEVGRAMYVPAVSYGYPQGLKYTRSTVEWVAIVLLLLVGVAGLFIAFLGHRFFQVEMFFFGYLAFKIILLLLVLKLSSLSLSACGVTALCCGLFGGLLWWLYWFFKGVPIVAVLMPGFTMGFVFASLIFNFTPLGQISLMQSSVNYGLAFSSAILLPSVILLYFTKLLNLLACSLVGSFMPLFAASLFFSGNFANMVLDSFKAVRDPAYLTAVKSNTPNINDIILCVLWSVLLVSSLVVQYLHQRHRPPFPPCPYQRLKKQRAQQTRGRDSADNVTVNGETEPLLRPQPPQRDNSYGTGLSMISQDPGIVDPI